VSTPVSGGGRLFAGCEPEVTAGPDGRILAIGAGARAAAGRRAEVVKLRGTALPGLTDAHVHLEGLAGQHLTLELAGAASLEETLERVETWARRLPPDAWVVGSGWYNDAWPRPAFPTRRHLDVAAGGRRVYLSRKDGHTAWVSSAALKLAGVGAETADTAGGVIDRDGRRQPTGILRETAMYSVQQILPRASHEDLDAAMSKALAGLAELGVTSVHSMDTARGFASLQRLHGAGIVVAAKSCAGSDPHLQ